MVGRTRSKGELTNRYGFSGDYKLLKAHMINKNKSPGKKQKPSAAALLLEDKSETPLNPPQPLADHSNQETQPSRWEAAKEPQIIKKPS